MMISALAFSMSWAQNSTSSSKGISISFKLDTLTEIPAPDAAPQLEILDITFKGLDNQGFISTTDKNASISYRIRNSGQGSAYNLRMHVSEKNGAQGINFAAHKFVAKQLNPGEVRTDTIPISGSKNLTEGKALFELYLTEGNGFTSEPAEASLITREYSAPKLDMPTYEIAFSNETEVQLKMTLRNTGAMTMKNAKVTVNFPASFFSKGDNSRTIPSIKSYEDKELVFTFARNDAYDKNRKYDFSVGMKDDSGLFSQYELVVLPPAGEVASGGSKGISDVDIPPAILNEVLPKEHTYALIIGNEKYNKVSEVQYALNDARIMASYCITMFNIPRRNIHVLENATGNQMKEEIRWIANQAKKENGAAELIIYYSGHGIVDVSKSGAQEFDQYLVPTDVSNMDASLSISRQHIYSELSDIPCKRVSIFLDACNNLLHKGLVKTPVYEWKGKFFVLASSSISQFSSPYVEKKHGFFTYFLLKNLQETRGNITFDELSQKIITEVETTAKEKARDQRPELITSPEAGDAWRKWKFTD